MMFATGMVLFAAAAVVSDIRKNEPFNWQDGAVLVGGFAGLFLMFVSLVILAARWMP